MLTLAEAARTLVYNVDSLLFFQPIPLQMDLNQQRLFASFPRSARYEPEWIRKNSIGENVLFNLESLTQVLALRPDMRVLDLGCGKAISSVFLAKEFGVQVWATDPQISATANYERIRESGCENQVFPLQVGARDLPFPEEFFDLVVVIDAYTYFGTDDKYLPYICKFIKPGGHIGVVDIGFTHEIETFEEVPDFLKNDYQAYWYFVHSLDWWVKMWKKTGLVSITCAELIPQANELKQQYINDYAHSKKEPFKNALEQDDQNLITLFRLVGQRTQQEVRGQV